jgi:hypothetical protein
MLTHLGLAVLTAKHFGAIDMVMMRLWAFTNTPKLIKTDTMWMWAFYDLDHTDPNCGLGRFMARRAELASRKHCL